jgi:hypothetical protein
MPTPLTTLPITPDELDHLTGLDVGSIFVGGVIRPSVFRSRRRLLSLVITELLVMGTLFIIGVGLALVLVRQREDFDRLGLLLLAIGQRLGRVRSHGTSTKTTAVKPWAPWLTC